MAPVNGKRVTPAIMARPREKEARPPKDDPCTRRYLALVDELMREESSVRPAGAQTRVAERIGASQSGLAKIMGNTRGVGVEVLHAAVRSLRIDPRYFFDRREPATYREYMTSEPPFPAWREFLESPAGRELDDAERRALASIDLAEFEPSADFYEAVLFALARKAKRVEAGRHEPAAAHVIVATVQGPPRVVVDDRAESRIDRDDAPEARVVYLRARAERLAAKKPAWAPLVEDAVAIVAGSRYLPEALTRDDDVRADGELRAAFEQLEQDGGAAATAPLKSAKTQAAGGKTGGKKGR